MYRYLSTRQALCWRWLVSITSVYRCTCTIYDVNATHTQCCSPGHTTCQLLHYPTQVLQAYGRRTVSALVGSRTESAEEWAARLRGPILQLKAAVTVHCVSLRVNSFATLTFFEDGTSRANDRCVCMRDLTILYENTKLFSLGH